MPHRAGMPCRISAAVAESKAVGVNPLPHASNQAGCRLR
jgi:hypothetical protein